MSKALIYFIQHGLDGPIKIGRTEHYLHSVRERLWALQIGNPVELYLARLTNGDSKQEYELHKHFANLRIRGEWFTYDHSIITYPVEGSTFNWTGTMSITDLTLAIHGSPLESQAHRWVCNNRANPRVPTITIK